MKIKPTYLLALTILLIEHINLHCMLNPKAIALNQKTFIPLGSSYLMDEKERSRIEKLAITPDNETSDLSHLQQVQAARNRVFSENWPEERVLKVFEKMAEVESSKPKLNSLATWHDWSSVTSQQSGDTCGYHAVYNMQMILSALEKKSFGNIQQLLQQGPPIKNWQDFIVSIGGRKSNLNDEDIQALVSKKTDLPPEQVTIIPNLRDWTPNLDESFQYIAERLQKIPESIHGFLINTAGHATRMNPAVRQQIINTLEAKPLLQKLFVKEMFPHLSAQEENLVVEELYKKGRGPLISAVTSLHKPIVHQGFGGHWTAIVLHNNNGRLEMHLADSAHEPVTQKFGNTETAQKLLDWVTTDPQILHALTIIPTILETAKMVLETNGDIQGATRRLKEVNEIIEKTPRLKQNSAYKDHLLPEIAYISDKIKPSD